MIRLYFTAADLAKITFASDSNALVEISLSVHRLHRWRAGLAQPRPGTRRWHRELGNSFEARAGVLFDLIPRRSGGWVPCFLSGADRRRSGRRRRTGQPDACRPARRGSEPVGAGPEVQPPGPGTVSGTAGARQALADDLRTYFDSSLASLWSQVRATTVTDRALRSEILLRGGIQRPIRHTRLRRALAATDPAHTGPVHLRHPPEGTWAAVGAVVLHDRIRGLRSSRPSPRPVLIYPMHLGEVGRTTARTLWARSSGTPGQPSWPLSVRRPPRRRWPTAPASPCPPPASTPRHFATPDASPRSGAASPSSTR